MKNEAKWKLEFKKSVRRYGGFSISLAAPMLNGLPDLFCVMPGFAPLLLEAKDVGITERDKFSRKVLFTELQINYIKHCDNVCKCSAMGLAFINYQKKLYCILLEYGTPQFYQLTNSFIKECAWCTYESTERKFDVGTLFNHSKVARMNFQFGRSELTNAPSSVIQTNSVEPLGDLGANTTLAI